MISLISLLISFIILILALYKTNKSKRKFLLELKLSSVYDKLELEIIKTKKFLTNEDLKFLQVNKNIACNPSFLDYEVLIALKNIINEKNIPVDDDWFERYVELQSDEIKSLLKDYKEVQVELVYLSIFKIKFIARGLIMQLNNFIKSKTFSLKDLIDKRISSTLYTKNVIQPFAHC